MTRPSPSARAAVRPVRRPTPNLSRIGGCYPRSGQPASAARDAVVGAAEHGRIDARHFRAGAPDDRLVRLPHAQLHVPGRPAGGLFDHVVELAGAAEEAGFSLVTVMDHLYQIAGVGPETEPMLEGWSMLDALARETSASASGRSSPA